jgi:UDP-glucose 4-epimerase
VKALVTGAAGFIGSHVVDHLLLRGYGVVALDDLSGGSPENVNADADFVQGNVLDDELLAKLFQRERITHVFHLAAFAAEGLSFFTKRMNYEVNVIGSTTVVNAAVSAGTVECIVFTSSIAVYGNATPPVSEEISPVPQDPYGIAKLAVEQDLRVTRDVFDVPYIVFRPHNVYGERQNMRDRYRNVIGIFMRQALSGTPLTIFGDGNQSRAFTHIDDVAPVIAASIDEPAARDQIYNVGSDQPYSINELAGMVARALNLDLQVEHLPARHEPHDVYADHSKLRKTFGKLLRDVPLEEGLEQMASWAARQGAAELMPPAEIEVSRNLPPIWR